jgi:hypothetical protein
MRDCRLLDGKLQYAPEPLDKLQYRSLHQTVLLCSECVDGVQAGSATSGDGGAVGAQGHANIDLPGPLFDHVGEQTVEPNEGDKQRLSAKNAHDSSSQFLRTDGVFHGFRHGGKFADGEMGIDFGDLATQLVNQRAGATSVRMASSMYLLTIAR